MSEETKTKGAVGDEEQKVKSVHLSETYVVEGKHGDFAMARVSTRGEIGYKIAIFPHTDETAPANPGRAMFTLSESGLNTLIAMAIDMLKVPDKDTSRVIDQIKEGKNDKPQMCPHCLYNECECCDADVDLEIGDK